MRVNKKDFELQIMSRDIPKDIGLGITRLSIFKGNIVLRFAALDNSGGCARDPIISKFNVESLDESRKELEKKLTMANLEAKSAQKLVTFIVEKMLDKMEQPRSVPSQAIPEGLDYNDDSTKDRTEYIYKPTFIEVYHGNEENRIEVFPSISSCMIITKIA